MSYISILYLVSIPNNHKHNTRSTQRLSSYILQDSDECNYKQMRTKLNGFQKLAYDHEYFINYAKELGESNDIIPMHSNQARSAEKITENYNPEKLVSEPSLQHSVQGHKETELKTRNYFMK